MKFFKGLIIGLPISLLLWAMFIGVVSFLLSGCMGTAPVLVDQYQYGDEKLSCLALKSKIAGIDEQAELKKREREAKLAGNAVITTAGVLLFPPALFFLDGKSDEKAEIKALLNRREMLWNIYYGKSCQWDNGEIKAVVFEEPKPAEAKEVDKDQYH